VALLLAVGASEGASDSRQVVQASEILAAIERGGPVEYNGVIVEGDLDLSERTLESVHFNNTIFHGFATFRGTNFNGDAWFIEANFSEYANFRYAEFSGGDTNFSYAVFSSGDANFPHAVFSGGDADFSNAVFSGGDADFSNAVFSGGDADFSNAVFSGSDAYFRYAVFSGGYADFSNAEFSGSDAYFRYAVFSGGDADFSNAVFSGGDADFYKAVFSGGDANFSNAVFSGGKADFASAEFSGGDANFLRAEFNWYANFNACSFEGDATFSEAVFNADSSFRWAHVEGDADFSGAKVIGYAEDLNEKQFRRYVDFREKIPASEILAKTITGEPLEYNSVIVVGSLDLSERNLGTVCFNNTIFLDSVNFQGSNFGGDSWFCGAEFSSGDADFRGAEFSGGRADFKDVEFSGGDADFEDANFPGGDANFEDAVFWDGDANFENAVFSYGDANFKDAEFSGGDANFEDAEFSGGDANFEDAEFSGGDANFENAVFSGGDAYFYGAEFSGGEADFWDAEFSGTVFIDWYLIDKQICDDVTYLYLVRNFRETGQFKSADDCYYDYRKQSMAENYPSWSTFTDFLAWITCGFGVRPSYTLYWSLSIVFFFGLAFWLGNGIYRYTPPKNKRVFEKTWTVCDVCSELLHMFMAILKGILHLPKNILITLFNLMRRKISFTTSLSLKDGLYFSSLVFVSQPPHDWRPKEGWKYAVMVEDTLGWLLLALFLVTLGNVMIR